MAEGRAPLVLAVLGVLAAGIWAYANGLDMPFVFDDVLSIVESPNVRSLWPPAEALTGPAGSGASGRPLVALSLALNHAVGGLEPLGYHVANVGLHLAAAVTLLLLARRVLARTSLAHRALPLAFAVALLWVLHPLHTDALDQVVYRGETMVALFLLLALLALERIAAGDGGPRARLGAVLAMAAAMASKEVAVCGPLLVLAWDRTLCAGSLREAWRRRKGLHLALAATWLVLALSILSGDRGASVGWGQDRLSSLDYLRTQAGAIVHYLRLSAWPRPLRFDYFAWPVARGWGAAVAPGAVVLALLVACSWAFARRVTAGLVGLAFFAVLAPSSSVLPIAAEWVAEHRMVLPLACVLGLVVPAVWWLVSRTCGRAAGAVGVVLLSAGALSLGLATRARHRDYRSAEVLWQSVLAVDPTNARAHDQLAQALAREGRAVEALPHAEEALRRAPELVGLEASLGSILLQLGRAAEAVPHLAAGRVELPDSALVAGNLGAALGLSGRLPQAVEALRASLELDPEYLRARANLAAALLQLGRRDEARREAHAVLARDPRDVTARAVLARLGG